MIEPALNTIMEKVDCRYSLVSVISERARQLVNDPNKMPPNVNAVTAAIDDLMNERIEYTKGTDYPVPGNE